MKIDALEKADLKAEGPAAVEEVFAEVSKDKATAARKALAYLGGAGADGAEALLAAGRRLVFNKGRDAHDYKFSSAVMEDYYHVTPHWRDRYLAEQPVLAARLRRQGQRPYRPRRAALAKG